VKRPLINTKSGQYTWLQLLSLVISGLFFWQGQMPIALVLLFLGTLFGVVGAIIRVREARQTNPEMFVRRRKR